LSAAWPQVTYLETAAAEAGASRTESGLVILHNAEGQGGGAHAMRMHLLLLPLLISIYLALA
jgi:hypothetical protein